MEKMIFYNDEMIQSFSNRKIAQLSDGELRYLEIKLVLCSPSKFVLLDEPYNGLSPLMIEKVKCINKSKCYKKRHSNYRS
jgi:ABC-type lipopolysaccharide export system ATPase subunit